MSHTSARVNDFLERAKRISQESKTILTPSPARAEKVAIRKIMQPKQSTSYHSPEEPYSISSTSGETPPNTQRSLGLSTPPYSIMKSPRFSSPKSQNISPFPKPKEVAGRTSPNLPRPKVSRRDATKDLESLANEILKAKKASERQAENKKENEQRALSLLKNTLSREKEKCVVDPQTKAIQELYQKKTQKFLSAVEEEVQQMSKRLKEVQEENIKLKKALAENANFSKEKQYFQDLNSSQSSSNDNKSVSTRIGAESKKEVHYRFADLSEDISNIKKLNGNNYVKEIESPVQAWFNNFDMEPEGYQLLKIGLCKKIIEEQEKRLRTEENANTLMANEENKIGELELKIKIIEMRSHSRSTDKFMEVDSDVSEAIDRNQEVLLRKLANTVLQNVYNVAVNTAG